jgi:diadenosine tetraphosphate (Ap4A) HIT family hydrolase
MATTCFLCEPDEDLVYLREGAFFAMLGHGPIGKGYSLIATAEHVASMLDLDASQVRELALFTEHVRSVLRPHYGEAVITEHGRVAPCVGEVTRRYEPHCLHAHRLVFPGQSHIDLCVELPPQGVVTFANVGDAWAAFDWPGQYLYAERSDATCQIAAAPRRLPRQLFRTIMARRNGEPEFADWATYPRLEEVGAARRELLGA